MIFEHLQSLTNLLASMSIVSGESIYLSDKVRWEIEFLENFLTNLLTYQSATSISKERLLDNINYSNGYMYHILLASNDPLIKAEFGQLLLQDIDHVYAYNDRNGEIVVDIDYRTKKQIPLFYLYRIFPLVMLFKGKKIKLNVDSSEIVAVNALNDDDLMLIRMAPPGVNIENNSCINFESATYLSPQDCLSYVINVTKSSKLNCKARLKIAAAAGEEGAVAKVFANNV